VLENATVLPTATISANKTLTCVGGLSPIVTLVGLNGTAPYTFVYTINGNLQPAITTIDGNSIGVTAPTSLAGDFIYQLVSVSDSSGMQSQNMSVTINVINPSVDFTTDSNLNTCSGDAIVFTPTITNGSPAYSYQWNLVMEIPQT